MLLIMSGHNYRFECENLCRVFFPYSPVRVESADSQDRTAPEPGEPRADTLLEKAGDGWLYTIRASDGQRELSRSVRAPETDEYLMTRLLFDTLSELTGVKPAWGMLTGVHPVKLLRQHVERLGLEAGMAEFREKWLVSEGRAQLAGRVLKAQKPAVEELRPDDYSLYVGIPFCPTRCAYCSFISQDMAHAKKLVEPYLELLYLELERTARIAGELGLGPISVYIGGGTPTTLSAQQLRDLCAKIRGIFPMDRCREFTVEAGRPDTLSLEKLMALKEANVDRISINPQTMSDRVLQNIGRRHTARDVIDGFELARKVGFRDINADLIVGLPGDSPEGFADTIRRVLELSPTNVTVHSLAIKRSADIVMNEDGLSLHKHPETAAHMMDHAIKTLTEAGFEPYYLYRQTRMAGNLENTGWALPGSVCRYNIYTMDESGTVIACGAGGVTKLKDPYSPDLKRIFNFKYPFEYISRHGEILERKEGIREIYEQFRQRLY